MIYRYKIKVYNDDTKQYDFEAGVIFAENRADAMSKLEQYYGDFDDLICFRAIADGCLLPVKTLEDSSTYFEQAINQIEEDWVW